MRYLVDTNVLLRWMNLADPEYGLVRAAVQLLASPNDELLVSTQNLIEYWNVATRPATRNGFGFSPSQALLDIDQLEQFFSIAPDDPRVYPEWRSLVAAVGVSGVQVHDARLAAVMRVHGISHILTLNGADFARYPGIIPVHPRDV